MQQGLLEIGIDQLMPDPSQPRKSFLKEEIERLAVSVAARGILQPLRVKRDAERQCYQIIIGECRWRAARLAGLKTVPCIEADGDISETEILIDQIVENSVRHSLRPLEQARSIAKLKALMGTNSQTLAKELGLSNSGITRAEALLTLPHDVQAMVDEGRVPESAAYEISRLPGEQAQRELALAVAGGRLNRDRVQETVRGAIGKRNVTPKASRLSCRLDGGIAFTLSSGQPLTWDDVLPAMDRIRKEAKKLYENGKEVTELARSLRAS
jgi:ParB family chromosome partitioning protein